MEKKRMESAAMVVACIALAVTLMPKILGGGIVRTKTLVIEDASGATRMMLTAAADGAPRILLQDSSGDVRLSLELAPLGQPGIFIRNGTGDAIRLTTMAPGEQPEISLYDSQRKLRWQVLLDPDGMPRIVQGD